MGTEFYTDDNLAQNFVKLTDFGTEVVDAIQSLTTLAERTETRLTVLETLSLRPTVIKVKNGRLLFLMAMGLSGYAGYKYAEQKLREVAPPANKPMTNHPTAMYQTDKPMRRNDFPKTEN